MQCINGKEVVRKKNRRRKRKKSLEIISILDGSKGIFCL